MCDTSDHFEFPLMNDTYANRATRVWPMPFDSEEARNDKSIDAGQSNGQVANASIAPARSDPKIRSMDINIFTAYSTMLVKPF